MKKSTLIINLNEDYKIKIENESQFKESIFIDVYKSARDNVIEIVNQTKKESYYDDFNNIIAFTGERGKGKSSSMISFRDALINKSNSSSDFFKNIAHKKFATIDIIDPSLFRGDEGLFEIILAKMFQEFQKAIKESNSPLNQDDKRELIQNFQAVFEDLQIINSDRSKIYEKESIEALSKLASSSNLRDCFKTLTENYLNIFKKGKDYLVIAIDDFDLNISGAYVMLEDIRQFLIQKKVIILIACKMEQLEEAIKIYYKKEKLNNKLENKTKKYLEKLIPFNRRNNLPDVQKMEGLNIKVFNDEGILFPIINNKIIEELGFNSSILKIIYDKTGILFTYDKLNRNSLIPETLRQTQSLTGILFQSERNIKIRLIEYILEESKSINELNIFLKEIENVSDDLFLFVLVKKLIKRYLSDINKDILRIVPVSQMSQTQMSFRKLYNAKISNTISIADVSFLLREYEDNIEVDDYERLNAYKLLAAYISLRISVIKDEKHKFLRFGFFNDFLEILAKDNGVYSRDNIEFEKGVLRQVNELNENERFIFSLWVSSLGDGYNSYRVHNNKDIYVEGFESGRLSPFSIFHNMYNIVELEKYLNIEVRNDDLYKDSSTWFEKSNFINQLYNPSFTILLVQYIKEFRNIEIKSPLPEGYYDTICLLFTYGMIYSLDKIEGKYKINGLVDDFLRFPVIALMVSRLKKTNKTQYKAVNRLNEKHNVQGILSKEFNNKYNISNELFNFFDKIFREYKDQESINNPSSYPLPEEAKRILNKLLFSIIPPKKFTSRLITNRIEELEKIDGVDNSIIDYLEKIKYKFNSQNSFGSTRKELIQVLEQVLKNAL